MKKENMKSFNINLIEIKKIKKIKKKKNKKDQLRDKISKSDHQNKDCIKYQILTEFLRGMEIL